MAKKFVKVSLATKVRLLFGLALLGIIAAALAVPWYFMEQLAEQGVQQPGAELARLGYNEYVRAHMADPAGAREDLLSLAAAHTSGAGAEGRRGPALVDLTGHTGPPPADADVQKARQYFERRTEEDLRLFRSVDAQDRTAYRVLRAVRAEPACLTCHGAPEPAQLQFKPGQLVAMIDASLPATAATGPLVWWSRATFFLGGAVGVLVAFVLFTVITQRLILRPVRRLREMADKVAEGDLTVRSALKTGDELQRLGDSYNEMLGAIADQHDKLRSANRALDLKLSELAEANVTLYRANQVKSEFLANVSHELRTPLNSIIGFADLVGESADERAQRYVQNIVSSAKHLLNMINDILDLAKIEAGKAEVRFDKVSVTDSCQTLLALMRPLADKKQLELRAELSADVPIITTDGGKLQQVLYNLLSNAIKFTPPGGRVALSTVLQEVQRGGRAEQEVSISVADTGPGIAESQHQLIFEKFHRLDSSLTRESAGTGLGLAISKELTALLGGRLTLKSSPGQGAVFTLTLPAEPRRSDVAEVRAGA